MFFKRFFTRKKEEVKSNFTIAKETLLSIELDKFPNVYSSDYSMVRLNSLCPTIESYNVLLKTVIEAFKFETVLYPSQVSQHTSLVYLKDFYLHNNCYIDTKEATKTFIELSLELLEIWEKSELLIQKSFEIEKLLTITANLISNITVISKEIHL